ncbi:hypothetical protein BHK98_02620 [Hornefia porci]|uniref:Uncharacterized protein n=1 Tax=Hornefia porci TaxID=2652292 RepID=A0A1Q9JFP5_9FIRM|nr:hypothetical protein [Hornefia porci]OLR55056.1 hypothetical protein BHK98_02620 [Hornefia porci]
MKFLRKDNQITFCGEYPIDKNDPAAAKEAIELTLPEGFSKKAKECWDYFDGAAFIFEYKGRLVITDEAVELTEAGDGSRTNPWGAPRWIVDSWEELEQILEETYDELKEEEII